MNWCHFRYSIFYCPTIPIGLKDGNVLLLFRSIGFVFLIPGFELFMCSNPLSFIWTICLEPEVSWSLHLNDILFAVAYLSFQWNKSSSQTMLNMEIISRSRGIVNTDWWMVSDLWKVFVGVFSKCFIV